MKSKPGKGKYEKFVMVWSLPVNECPYCCGEIVQTGEIFTPKEHVEIWTCVSCGGEIEKVFEGELSA